MVGGKASWLLLGSLLCAGCSNLADGSPLEGARNSPEALAEAALDALAAEEESSLAALMITRHEYETLLWPSLPDRKSVPFSFAWGMNVPRSRKARRENIEKFGGLPLDLVRVDLGDDIEEYEAFTLYLNARMTVRRRDTGEEGLIPLMDALVEMGGGWKFMNFKDDL
jgi:hypothetical protein